jgi:transcription elongation factor Elf1
MLDGMEKIANIEFDLPDFLTNNNMSSEEFEVILVSFTQKIVDRRFPNDIQKRKIRIHKNKRITFSCPICGDSMQSSWKQRGNIILEGKHKYYYKCFNCGEFKRVDQFFKDFKIDLSLDVISYISDNKGDFYTSVGGRYDISLLLDVSTIEKYAIDREELKSKFNLIEVKESSIWSWLNKRLQFDAKKFLYSVVGNYLLILNLTPSGKILGFQKRPFQSFKGSSRYLTYSLTGIYELLKKEEKVPDEIDTLSQLFDICTINFNQSVTVFEGPMDSFLFHNSIANGGANKHFPLDIPRRYFYDDDKTGRNNVLKRIEEGYSIFLWERFKHEYGLPFKPENDKKWDLNNVMLWLKNQGTPVPMWDKYFSNDPMDAIDL